MTPVRAPRLPALRYRPARRTDLDALADLGYRSYRMRTLEARREYYADHPRFSLTDVRVGELDGELVASLVLLPFTAFVRSQRVPMTGIASVAVSPEHRRRGIGEALLRATLREMRQRGDALSVLYAFRNDFYRRLGYGLIERPHLVSAPPAHLPASPEARRVRRLRLPDRPHVEALYARLAQERGHFALERRPEWWQRRLWDYEGEWVVYERQRGRIEGYLHLEVDASDGPWKLVLTVNELMAATPEAMRGLVGYLHSLRDQAIEVALCVPDDGVWPVWLADAGSLRGEMKMGGTRTIAHTGSGAMLRLVDVKSALEALPVAAHARGEVALEVRDDLLPANARTWRVHAHGGRLQVLAETPRMQGSRSRLPRFACAPDVLGSLVAGALSPVVAAEAGLAEDVRGGAAVLEPWFRGRPAFVHLFNGF